jgi:hypothetical protein
VLKRALGITGPAPPSRIALPQESRQFLPSKVQQWLNIRIEVAEQAADGTKAGEKEEDALGCADKFQI